MQTSLAEPQFPPIQKVKNILIRRPNKGKQNKNPQHLERSYTLRYCPKYYKSLAIEIRPENPPLSKIKKVKKLKKPEGRTGAPFKASYGSYKFFLTSNT